MQSVDSCSKKYTAETRRGNEICPAQEAICYSSHMNCFSSITRSGCLLIHPYPFSWSFLFPAAHSNGLSEQSVPSNGLYLTHGGEKAF